MMIKSKPKKHHQQRINLLKPIVSPGVEEGEEESQVRLRRHVRVLLILQEKENLQEKRSRRRNQDKKKRNLKVCNNDLY